MVIVCCQDCQERPPAKHKAARRRRSTQSRSATVPTTTAVVGRPSTAIPNCTRRSESEPFAAVCQQAEPRLLDHILQRVDPIAPRDGRAATRVATGRRVRLAVRAGGADYAEQRPRDENAAVPVQVVDQPSVPTAYPATGRWRATEACPVCSCRGESLSCSTEVCWASYCSW